MSSRREWLARLALIVSSPILFLAALEATLLLVGYGYPTSFFSGERNAHITNERYGWRLFPRAIARTPAPEVIPDTKTKRRTFLLGESAAMGFPDPALGLAPFLQAALGPGWDVTNAAMSAINSHTVREIAAECARLQPDAFIVYMGNNEIVGPYGAGSVFGSFTGNLALIRAHLWLKSWRLGQLLTALTTRPRPEFDEWRGLEFFLHSQIPAGDPRLARVYHHFRHNLRAIIRTGRRAGARVLVSTVAVNLRDCPPLASPDGAAQRAFAAGDYARARDLDALRFRADSTINRIIREVAAEERAELLDAEAALEPTSADFWEHVHLRPHANRRLAELFAQMLTGRPKTAELPVTPWDEDRLSRTIAAILERPPFTEAHRVHVKLPSQKPDRAQARAAWQNRVNGNPDDLLARERLAELAGELRDYAAAESLYRNLLTRISLRTWHTGLAEALLNRGRFAKAEQSYRDALEIDDRFAPAILGLGITRAAQNDIAGAEAMFRSAIAIQFGLAEAHNSLGRLLASQGKWSEAAAEFQIAVDRRQDFAIARYNLASVLVRLNRTAQAITELRQALKAQPDFPAARYDLGLLLAQQGSLDEAIHHYAESLRLNPQNPDALNNWGAALARQSRVVEARRKFEAALAIDPRHAAARRNLELLLGQ